MFVFKWKVPPTYGWQWNPAAPHPDIDFIFDTTLPQKDLPVGCVCPRCAEDLAGHGIIQVVKGVQPVLICPGMWLLYDTESLSPMVMTEASVENSFTIGT